MTTIPNIEILQKIVNSANFLETRPAQMPEKTAEQVLNCLKGKDLPSFINNIPNESWKKLDNVLTYITKMIFNNYSNYYQMEMPLACLSEKYNNVLMWAHYADNHKGFVIEYDSDTLKTDCEHCPQGKNYLNCPDWKEVVLLPILYTNQRYDATEYIYDNSLIKMFETIGVKDVWKLKDDFAQYKINIFKQNSWSYEKEWRLQLYKTNNDKFIKVKPIAIYLGCRIAKCHEDILVQYAQAQNIKIYKMTENPSKLTYSLTKKKY